MRVLTTFVIGWARGRRKTTCVFIQAHTSVVLMGRRGMGGQNQTDVSSPYFGITRQQTIDSSDISWMVQSINLNHINRIRNWVGAGVTQSDLCFHQGSYVGGVDRGKIQPMCLVHIWAPLDNISADILWMVQSINLQSLWY